MMKKERKEAFPGQGRLKPADERVRQLERESLDCVQEFCVSAADGFDR